MKEIVRLMIDEYNTKRFDWMGYKVNQDNPYTYHHLKKKCLGGKEEVRNGALLSKYGHQYLHILEQYDLELYELLNNVLIQINEQYHEPLKRQILAINYILEMFEKRHKYAKNSKGKMLLKEEYKNRFKY